MLDYSKIKKIKVGNHDMWIYNGELSSLGNSEFTEYVRYINSQGNEKEGTKMSKKFTEEQYQKIVEAWRSENLYIHQTEAVIDYLIDDFNVDVTLGEEALAIANPLTREWAHEQFVEKEKKYTWTLKKVDKSGIKMHLYKDYFEKVQPFFSVTNVNIDDNEKLTEKEIREWGYNPEMFDKE